MEEPRRPIVFFDGECGLCNRFVDRVLRADRAGLFAFAPLQGETARRLLPPLPPDPREWSVVLLDGDGPRYRSDATLEIQRRLGGLGSVVALARFLPRLLRDPVYRLVARTRYALFGKRTACRVPTEAERGRFLP